MSAKKIKNVPSLKLDHKLSVGSIVWAKLRSYSWWPAIIIRSTDCSRPEAKFGNSWVFWFGDHKISEISRKNIFGFVSNFHHLFCDASGKRRKAAIYEALEVLADRCSYHSINVKDLVSWAKNQFQTLDETSISSSDLPPLVLKHLKNIRKSRENAGSCSMDTYTEDSSTEKVLISNVPLNKVRDGSLKIEDMCISCKLETTIVDCHPLFEGGICFECKESLKENIYSYGYDGKTMCCVICAHPGCLILCDNKDCFRSYCSKCITELIGSENLHKIREMNPWQCFFCSNDDYDDSLLKTRKDWEERLLNCFQPIKTLLQEFSLSDYKIKKPIRVLSLFDGIGTGRVVLDLLGIKVEKYYASEIDDNAINVSKFHFNDSITYIGNIRNLTDEKIQSISPIDLVIGGSPCNDLSLVNPERKGIYDFSGTGYLFFDFFHVLKSVQRLNNQKHVFFLFENVASMNQKTKRIISSFLMQEPALIDSKFVSPQARARYFWGNIPGMHTLYKYWTSERDENLDVGFQKETLLSHCLLENLGRKAVVEKIRTVTTQKNSLIQENCTVLPVEMNGEPDSLWLTELEKVFGFPVHFTDIGNLSISKRQELIGRSWSVPVVKDILRSFKRFFKCEDDPLI